MLWIIRNFITTDFYKTSKAYLEYWCQFDKEVEIFEWANSRMIPIWEKVQKVMEWLIEQKFINSETRHRSL